MCCIGRDLTMEVYQPHQEKKSHRSTSSIAGKWPRSPTCLETHSHCSEKWQGRMPHHGDAMQCFCKQKWHLGEAAWGGKRASAEVTGRADAANSRWCNWGTWAASDMGGDQVQLLGCRDSQAAGSGAVLAAGSARRKRAAKSAVVLPGIFCEFLLFQVPPMQQQNCRIFHRGTTPRTFPSHFWDFG